jgi:hypothetical protein
MEQVMTQTVARDTRTRPPMPPPKGVSVADNLPVSWVEGWRWAPGRPGFFYIGPTMYRLDSLGADAASESWHVAKLVERPGRETELATPFTVCIPIPGSAFAASCDCPAWRWSKDSPRRCKHTAAVMDLREQLECHAAADDAVDRFEAGERLAVCGAAN